MKFRDLAESFQKIEDTSGRLDMMGLLAEAFKKASASEIDKIIYMSQGVVAAPFEGLEVGMGEKFVMQAIATATGYSRESVEKNYKKSGDLGDTAQELIKEKRQQSLHREELGVAKVFDSFTKIAKISGAGTQDKKIDALAELLNSATPLEAKYIIRFPIGKLRLGAGDATVLEALSIAKQGDRSAKDDLERAYNLCSDLGLVAKTYYEKGLEGIKKFHIMLFHPVRPALAERLPSAEEIVEKLGKCAVDAKYDGFRCVGGFTPIYVKGKGLVSIKDVHVGDYVLTHTGNFRKVLAKNKRRIDKGERIFRLHTYLGNRFTISEGHKIRICNGAMQKWVNVEDVPNGAYTVFPIPKLDFLPRAPENALELRDSSGYTKKVELDEKFYRFLGMWVGDGFTNEFHNTERIGLIFNQKTESGLCDEYETLVKDVFAVENISRNLHNGAVYLYWRDPPFKDWLSKNFRREWRGKMLPAWFGNITPRQFDAFLKGWFEADGHEDKFGRRAITTKERDLAMFAQLLCLKNGHPAGASRGRIKLKANGHTYTYHKLILAKKGRRTYSDGKNILVKLFRKEELKRPDPRMHLYNLQVDGDESYCTPMVTLHNCQIHKKGDDVEIYSRRLEKTTTMFPELVEGVKRQVKAEEAIFEGEALAVNEETGEFYPFQLTMQRKRKYGVEKMAEDYPLKLFAFDLLYADGKDYTKIAYGERRKQLEKMISKGGRILPSDTIITDNTKELQKYFDECVEKGLEGIIAKDLNAEYVAGARKFAWIKLKRSYKGELADTIDVAIVGYFVGRGARAEFGFGGFLGAVYDENEERFKTVTKVGTGFTEEQMKELKKMLDKIKSKEKPKGLDAEIKPDVWVEPKYVVTLTADEITRSPNHTAGKTESESGYALRFPRLTSEIRTDKNAEDATTVAEIIKMFKLQKHHKLEE